jgi:hypothetical protein
MTFAESDLLLTFPRLSQLKAALANTGVPEPLTSRCIPEAVGEVTRSLGDYAASDDELRGWIRPIALWNAYSLVGPVPKDIGSAAEIARKALEDLRGGDFTKAMAGGSAGARVVTGTSARETLYNLRGL